MRFEFDRSPTRVEVFGKYYDIPTKTAYFVTAVNEILTKISKTKDPVETSKLTVRGIALFLGEDFVNEYYKDPAAADTDEIGALWVFLNSASAKATQEVLKSYAPAKLHGNP